MGKKLRLGVSASGHAYVKMAPQFEKTEDTHATENDEVPNAQPSAIENPVAGSGLAKEQLGKLHLQIGNGSLGAMSRLIKTSGHLCNVQTIQGIICECGFSLSRSGVERPIVRTYVPTRCASVIGLDIFYPVESPGHSFPYLICVDHLSRFAIVASLKNRRPEHVSHVWFRWEAQQGDRG